ncbi:MAG: phosphoadenylyl-sulfate reductase [Proteobacteria bacterium]|nr:phosphoadenylyl-sulfate reductase [Pseudomonadota bacterium]
MSLSVPALKVSPVPDSVRNAFIARLNAIAGSLDLFGRLKEARAALPGRLTFTTSFGLEDQAIAHAILAQGLDIDLVTLDTGRLFPETHDVWAATEQRYGVRIRAVSPEATAVAALLAEQGANGFRHSVAARQACCHVRKVLPLKIALDGAQGWITGLRADQSAHRAAVEFASIDAERGLVKINPLYDWTRDDAVAFTNEHNVPVNELHGRGFLSIGCAPCTRAIQPGESERAGRWWWEDEGKNECGLHANPLHLAARARLKEQTS